MIIKDLINLLTIHIFYQLVVIVVFCIKIISDITQIFVNTIYRATDCQQQARSIFGILHSLQVDSIGQTALVYLATEW